MNLKRCEVCNGTGQIRRQIFFWKNVECWSCRGSGQVTDVVATLLERLAPNVPPEIRREQRSDRRAVLDRARQRQGGEA